MLQVQEDIFFKNLINSECKYGPLFAKQNAESKNKDRVRKQATKSPLSSPKLLFLRYNLLLLNNEQHYVKKLRSCKRNQNLVFIYIGDRKLKKRCQVRKFSKRTENALKSP